MRLVFLGDVIFERVVRLQRLSDAVVNTLLLVQYDVLHTLALALCELPPERGITHFVQQLEKGVVVDCHYVHTDYLTNFPLLEQVLPLRLGKVCVESVLQFLQLCEIARDSRLYEFLPNQVIARLLPQAVHLLDRRVHLLLYLKTCFGILRVLRGLNVVVHLLAELL